MLTLERAHQQFVLDSENGALSWRSDSVPGFGRPHKAGERAGSLHKASGYWIVSIDAQRYREHVLIWFMLHGEWRHREIDHRDRNRANNRPSNLRLASESEQRANTGIRSDNTSGFRGVHKHPLCEKFQADVHKDGIKHYLGLFDTAEEAAAVAAAERLKLFGEYAPS